MNKHFLKILMLTGLSVTMLMPVVADDHKEQPELRDPVPTTYTVVKGDTLWDISETFLQNPWMWPEIWHVNAQIENPHLIYPGDVIRLIFVDGKPRLTLDNSGRIHKLSPSARVVSLGDAIETIPLDRINSFLSQSRVVSKEELKLAPYVLEGTGDHLIVGAGDKAYVRGQVDGRFSGYGIYRKGQEFRDPETNERLGIQAIDIGAGEVRQINGEIVTFYVNRANEEVRAGDRLLREEERAIESSFQPSGPSAEVSGVILAVEGGVSQVGKMDVVVINKGAREGIEPGNVMAVFKRGKKISDRVKGGRVKLPDERAGLIMIFRAFEKVSYALVLQADQGIKTNDIVKNP